jgi:hypothetical protein
MTFLESAIANRRSNLAQILGIFLFSGLKGPVKKLSGEKDV